MISSRYQHGNSSVTNLIMYDARIESACLTVSSIVLHLWLIREKVLGWVIPATMLSGPADITNRVDVVMSYKHGKKDDSARLFENSFATRP